MSPLFSYRCIPFVCSGVSLASTLFSAQVYMKVGYEISVLGKGLWDERSRAGIHRVVENQYAVLANRADLNVEPVCMDPRQLVASEAYVEGHEALYDESVRSILTEEDAAMVRVHSRLKRDASRLKRSLAEAFSLQKYLERKCLKSRLRASPMPQCILDLSQLERLDVYHSPHLPLQSEVLNQKRLAPFFTAHDFIILKHPEFFKGSNQEALSQYLAKLSGREWVCCVSESTRADLLEINPHVDSSRVFVTPLAAADHFYPCDDRQKLIHARERYGLPEGSYFLSLCTIEPRKNILGVLRAFVALASSGECPDVSLVLVGGLGWDYAQILDEIEGAKALKERIIMTGFVPDTELATIYSNALAFVYMSFYEGFGLPPLEAMQCGVPVVTSNNSSLPEVVGDAGCMLDANANDELCQVMIELYKNDSLRARHSEKSLARAAQFSWERSVQQTVDAYKFATESI